MNSVARESSIIIEANPAEVRRLGRWLADLLGDACAGPSGDACAGPPGDACAEPSGEAPAQALQERLELALHEICINVVDHAYQGGPGTIRVRGSAAPDRVWIEVTDQGGPFDQNAVTEPDPGLPQIRGYGLMIVRKLVDSVRYERVGDTNVWSVEVAVRDGRW